MSEVTQLTAPELAPPIGQAGHGAVDGFHPAVAEWFRRRFPDGPTEAQAQGWPHIATGADTLIAAPTGSGKTLAAFLVAIDRLYREHDRGVDVSIGTRVVYVSPLKALAVDIGENLERPPSPPILSRLICWRSTAPASSSRSLSTAKLARSLQRSKPGSGLLERTALLLDRLSLGLRLASRLGTLAVRRTNAPPAF